MVSRLSTTVRAEIRQIIFGLEDGMVSTLGAITGLASATQDRSLVLVSGLVIIAVESLSMAAGTYLSNKHEYSANHNGNRLSKFTNHLFRRSINPVVDAFYMGISYIIGGSLSLLPYWFLDIDHSTPASILLVVFSLFILGYQSAKITHSSRFKSALEMVFVSLSAAFIGFLVGKTASFYFPGIQHG